MAAAMSAPPQQQQSVGASDPQEALLEALKSGDLDAFSDLLSRGAAKADHWYDKPHYGSALEIACRHPDLTPAFVHLLLKYVSPNVHEPRPEPVHYAARCGNLDALRELLSHKKTKVSAQTGCGRTALHWAVLGFRDAPKDNKLAERLEACIATLVDCPLFDVDHADDEGFTALHLAALYEVPRAAAAIIDSCRRSRRPLQVDNYFGGRQTARQAVLRSLPQLSGRLPRPADGGAQTVHMRLLRAMDDHDVARYQRLMDAAAEKEGFDPDVWIEQPFNTRLLLHACQLAEHSKPICPQKEEQVSWLGEEERAHLPPLVQALFKNDDFRSFRDLLNNGAMPNVNNLQKQPIHYAAKNGNWRALAALLSHPDTRVNATDAKGRTALHEAVLALVEGGAGAPVEGKDPERCVQLLARCPRLDVNCVDVLGFTALHLAAQRRHHRAAAVLIDKCRSAHRDLDVDSRVVRGRTARQALAADLPDLAWELPPVQAECDVWAEGDRLGGVAARAAGAVDTSQLAIQFASITLEFGADPAAANLLDCRTALHVAAAASNTAIVDLLLSHPRTEQPALVNMRDRDGNTALHLAALGATSKDKLDCLQSLLNVRNVDTQLKNRQDKSAKDVAACKAAEDEIAKYNSVPSDQLPKDYCDYVSGLFQMIINNNVSELPDRLRAHRNSRLASTKYCGYTLLQYAAEKGIYEVAEALLENAKLSESSDIKERTPLMLACVQNDCKMVRLLLKADGIGGINVNAFDSKGNTALHFAAENGDLEMVLILLRHGADISARNKTGKYPFSVDQLESILHKNLYTKGNRLPSHRNYVIVFNYRLLLRHRQCSPPRTKLALTFGKCRKDAEAQPGAHSAHGLQNEYSEMYFLNCLINSEQHTTLLHHPVISSFLKLKYERSKWLLYLNILLCLVFAVFINTFIGVHVSNGDSVNQTEMSLRAVVIALEVIMSVRVLLQYLLSPLPCCENLENAVALLVVIFTAVVLIGSLGLWSHAALTAAVLSSWLHLFILTGRHHLFSKNFEMFKTVSKNYLHLLASYIFVIFAFAFSFYILFSHVPVSNQNTSIPFPENNSKLVVNQYFHKNSSEDAANNFFESPQRAIFKTVIMMTGEYDAGDLPFGSNFWTGAVVFLLFLFLLPVVLLNLLTALAISDEQRITKRAETLKLVTQVKFLWETEGMVMNAYSFLKKRGYCKLAERLETLWVFHNVPPNDACIEVWPNRVEETPISGTQGHISHKFKPHIVQDAINIVKNRTVSSAERNNDQYILSELLKRLESLEEKFQKLTVDVQATLTATARERQPEESLLGLPIQ